MIKVYGHDFMRDGVKIGYIMEHFIYDHSGNKMGYYQYEHIYDKNGRKLAFLDGDYIRFYDSSLKIRIEDNNKDINGGDLDNLQRAAVRILLGE